VPPPYNRCMSVQQLLSSMCADLSDADLDAIRKARGFSAGETTSRTSFANFYITAIGLDSALKSLSSEENITHAVFCKRKQTHFNSETAPTSGFCHGFLGSQTEKNPRTLSTHLDRQAISDRWPTFRATSQKELRNRAFAQRILGTADKNQFVSSQFCHLRLYWMQFMRFSQTGRLSTRLRMDWHLSC